jgi:hypothetical protein
MLAFRRTYSRLEGSDLLIGKSIGLGNNRNQVDLGVKSSHHLNVKGLERVTGRLDEENTSMDSVVDNVHAVDLVLSIQVRVESLLNVVDDRAPGLIVVDEVTETGCVNNGEAKTNTGLLDVGADRLDGNGLGNNVEARALALLRGVERGVEEGVDQCRLAQTRFTCFTVNSGMQHLPVSQHTNNHNVEVEAFADTLSVPLVGQVGEADVASELSSDNVPVISSGGWLRRNFMEWSANCWETSPSRMQTYRWQAKQKGPAPGTRYREKLLRNTLANC